MTNFTSVKDVYDYNVGSVEGTYAKYAVVPAKFLSKKPVSMNYIEAAGIPCIGLTAYQILIDGLNVQAGETVAITGATGGVDTIAVQNAIGLGACVVGTANGSAVKINLARLWNASFNAFTVLVAYLLQDAEKAQERLSEYNRRSSNEQR